MLPRVCLHSNSVQPLLAFQCLPSCVLPGLPSETMRACDRLHLRHRSSYQVRGSIYHAYNFQLTCLGIGQNDCLILPPYIHASQINPNSHVLHIPANHVLLCYYCSLLSPCLVCMLGCYQLLPPVTPWIGLSHYYYIVVDDMIIIIMLTIFDEGWKVQAIPPRRFVPFESPRTRVTGIVSPDERA